jgi:hypothetical protein
VAALQRQSKESKELKFTVADRPQLVTQGTTGDVRYFYQEDEEMATKIKESVERILKFSRIEKTLEVKPLLKLGNRVPQGWIEVWLPSLPAPSLNNQRPFMNNPYRQRSRPQAQ